MGINYEQVWSVKKIEQSEVFHEDHIVFMKFWFCYEPLHSCSQPNTDWHIHCPFPLDTFSSTVLVSPWLAGT